MRTISARINFGIISRSGGVNALVRSAYQMGGVARDARGEQRCFYLDPGEHAGQWLLLPRDAPEWDCGTLWQAAAHAERQCNSQEGRTIDFQIPREVPEVLFSKLAFALYGIFPRCGLAVQIDAHCRVASDGAANPHFHALVSMRRLTIRGFERTKARNWNALFREAGGRAMRTRLANAFNRFAARFDLAVRIDPRTNAERGLPPPELPLQHWAATSESSAARRMREELRVEREARANFDRADAEARVAQQERDDWLRSVWDAASQRVMVINLSASMMPVAWAEKIRRALSKTAGREGAPFGVTREAFAVRVDGCSIVVERDRLVIDGPITSAVTRTVLDIIHGLGWQNVRIHPGADPGGADRIRTAAKRAIASSDDVDTVERVKPRFAVRPSLGHYHGVKNGSADPMTMDKVEEAAPTPVVGFG